MSDINAAVDISEGFLLLSPLFVPFSFLAPARLTALPSVAADAARLSVWRLSYGKMMNAKSRPR